MSIVSNYYKQIPTSMTDFEGFYRRMAEQLPDGCTIAEVGVADGRSALMLADMLHELGKNFKLTMIDSCDYGHALQSRDIWMNIIKSGFDCIDFLALGSLDCSCKFADNYFDFVFVDASHKYEPTKADIRLWYHKIKVGGVLAGHDYLCKENPEVRVAVDEVIPIQALRTETTDKGHGLWWTVKSEYIKMN